MSIGFGAKCFFFFRLDCHKSESRLLVASFPGPARSSLAVRNSRRGPGLVHHVMSATVVFLRQQITMFAVLPIYLYNGVSS